MKYVAESKEIKVTNESFKTTLPDGEIKLSGHEVPQFESYAEAVSLAKNGETDVLEYLNGSLRKDALAEGRAKIKAIPANANLDVALAGIRNDIRSFDPFADTVRASVENKKKAATLDVIKSKLDAGETLSMDELQALIAQA